MLPSLGVVSGASVLAQIRLGPSSAPSARVKFVSPAFAPAYIANVAALRWSGRCVCGGDV